ncbi:NAD-binding protein [Actinoplanes sp. RD1]|uniref:NAD-binding protein n=1 Tax=Actinoplanes sp. RD1 TaxID=3064538 RepID=UPI0027410C4F|nr:NAD-binding protein [Actinoplanes sp. RD1]
MVPSGRRTAVVVRLGFVGLALVALMLGYIGLDQYFRQEALDGRTFLNLLYCDLQLFVLGADPLQGATDFPLSLQLARFAAPAVTLFALAEAGRLLLATQLNRIRARNARGHSIVCGDSAAAIALARNLARARRRTVLVRSRTIGPLELRRGRLLGITGDATDPDVLRGAGVLRATTIYACTDDSATNVAIATTAGRVLGSNGGQAMVYAQIHDPDRAVTLQARRLGVDASPGLRLDFFNLDQLAVHVLLTQRPLRPAGARPPRLLIAGDAPFARALLVGVARNWRLRRQDDASRLRIDLVAPGAAAILAGLRERYVIVDEACAVSAYDLELSALLRARRDLRYDDAWFCYRDEEYGLQLALTAHELWHRVRGRIFVPVERFAGLTDAFGDESGQPLLDQVNGKIRLIPKNTLACDPDLIAEDLVERLARLIHERYVISARRRPAEPTDPAALVDWADLDEERRRSSRAQAGSIGAKLHAIGCTIVARTGPDDFRLTPGEIDLLAAAEQQRWLDTAAAGWRYGSRRDEAAKRSPYVRAWDDLADGDREKARAAMRDLPAILADAGFQVVRLAEGTLAVTDGETDDAYGDTGRRDRPHPPGPRLGPADLPGTQNNARRAGR